MRKDWYKMEKVQSYCEVGYYNSKDELITLGFGWHTFYVRTNGFSATEENLLKAADEHIKIIMNDDYSVKSTNHQNYFGDASGPPGTPGVSEKPAGSRNDPSGTPPKNSNINNKLRKEQEKYRRIRLNKGRI